MRVMILLMRKSKLNKTIPSKVLIHLAVEMVKVFPFAFILIDNFNMIVYSWRGFVCFFQEKIRSFIVIFIFKDVRPFFI